LRVCASKAITVDGMTVQIQDDTCIRSGDCLSECPHDAIRAVGDVEKALSLLEGGQAVLILAVEAAAHFYPQTPEQVVNACSKAGFRAVHRGVIGDELVADEYRQLWEDEEWGTMIRSTCPVVVERIQREYPELVPYLAPFKTPLAAEAEYHRAMYGHGVRLVYAGICLADSDAHVDAGLTFDELGDLLQRRGVVLKEEPQHFRRIPSVRERFLSAAGGLPFALLQEERQSSRRFRKVRGLGGLDALARAVTDDRIDLGFVDILPCDGCLGHPLWGEPEKLFWRRRVVGETEPPRSLAPVVDPAIHVWLERAFELHGNGHKPPDEEINKVIEQIGLAPGGLHWDCGACGYSGCTAFAVAQIDGRASFRQCAPYHERRAEEATRVATTDHLTGLATFRTLKLRLGHEMARSDRSDEPFGVLFVDMDGFKDLNDTHGHEAGNRVLEGVGRELESSVRKTDMAARYGGDEFVLVLVHTDIQGAYRVGEMVRESIQAFGVAEGYRSDEVSVSVGVACHDPKDTTVDDAMSRADQALYQAKARGGNMVVAWGHDGAIKNEKESGA
jgi:diguanylate cyclase (GGDEF)-like protein